MNEFCQGLEGHRLISTNSPAPDTLTSTTHQGRGTVGEGFGKREPTVFPEAGLP